MKGSSVLLAMALGLTLASWQPAEAGFVEYQQAVSADSPVSWWHMSEPAGSTAGDVIGPNDNDGTYNGGVTLGQTSLWPAGFDGGDKAVSLDGSNDYVEIANESNFDFLTQFNGTWTVETWIKTTDTDNELVTKHNQDGAYGFETRMRPGGAGKVDLVISGGGGWKHWLTSDPVNDDAWHHLVWVSDAGTISAYVDNVAQTLTTSGTFTGTTNNEPVRFGTRGGTSYPKWFAGLMDETAIYSTALSSDRIAAHYGAAYAIPEPSSIFLVGMGLLGLIAWGLRRRHGE